MNKRYYREYANRKSKWYLVSYNIILKDGRTGFGSNELKISGIPDLSEIREYILEDHPEWESIVIMNIMRTNTVKTR